MPRAIGQQQAQPTRLTVGKDDDETTVSDNQIGHSTRYGP